MVGYWASPGLMCWKAAPGYWGRDHEWTSFSVKNGEHELISFANHDKESFGFCMKC